MLLYEDILTGDELFSDAYPIKEVDDIVYEVDCQMINKKKNEDVDIGANPSAEDAPEEGLDETVERVNNVVDAGRLQQTSFDKKGYLAYLKGYMKNVKKHLAENNPERVEAFEKGAAAYAKKIVGNFKDLEFYTGEKFAENPDREGMVLLLNYREDGITPYFTCWKDGLKTIKL
ncbi:translationally-controlled tumor protein [Ceratobasidium sp. AG-Ba]|nr:translationally-controlled tumor protein [Ceratobasidium sp. AG-Ba]